MSHVSVQSDAAEIVPITNLSFCKDGSVSHVSVQSDAAEIVPITNLSFCKDGSVSHETAELDPLTKVLDLYRLLHSINSSYCEPAGHLQYSVAPLTILLCW